MASHTVAKNSGQPGPACPAARVSRTLLPTMSVPIPFPEPARHDQSVRAGRLRAGLAAVTVSLVVVAGTALLGLAAGYAWARLAPRAWLVMTAPGSAGLINAETSAYIVADALFCLVCVIGGVLSGVL